MHNSSPIQTMQPDPPATIAIIVSHFNETITNQLLAGAQQRLRELATPEAVVIEVPGAIEIPLIAQQLARKKCYEAIIVLGAVIRGETTHYDYVCQQVSNGCQQVALAYHIPVIFGVLTTENEQQAIDRVGGTHGHKGRDAADAACQMINLLRQHS